MLSFNSTNFERSFQTFLLCANFTFLKHNILDIIVRTIKALIWLRKKRAKVYLRYFNFCFRIPVTLSLSYLFYAFCNCTKRCKKDFIITNLSIFFYSFNLPARTNKRKSFSILHRSSLWQVNTTLVLILILVTVFFSPYPPLGLSNNLFNDMSIVSIVSWLVIVFCLIAQPHPHTLFVLKDKSK